MPSPVLNVFINPEGLARRDGSRAMRYSCSGIKDYTNLQTAVTTMT